MHIVPLEPDDLDAVAKLEVELFPWPRSRASYVEELANPQATLLGAKNDSAELLGYILFWIYSGECHLQQLGVAPDSQRQGIATALVEAMLAEAKRQGATEIYLDVRAGNSAALALYKRFGFVEIGRRERYYPNGEDAIVMRKNLLFR